MAERTVLRMSALMGDSPASMASSAFEPSAPAAADTLMWAIWPTVPRMEGIQRLFAAATVMRPATKEFPSAEPAITRQMRAVAK